MIPIIYAYVGSLQSAHATRAHCLVDDIVALVLPSNAHLVPVCTQCFAAKFDSTPTDAFVKVGIDASPVAATALARGPALRARLLRAAHAGRVGEVCACACRA